MNLNTIELEVKEREHAANRIEYSILFLKNQPDNYKHQEALRLLEYELFYRKDQLFNYRMLVDILKDEENGSVPETE